MRSTCAGCTLLHCACLASGFAGSRSLCRLLGPDLSASAVHPGKPGCLRLWLSAALATGVASAPRTFCGSGRPASMARGADASWGLSAWVARLLALTGVFTWLLTLPCL